VFEQSLKSLSDTYILVRSNAIVDVFFAGKKRIGHNYGTIIVWYSVTWWAGKAGKRIAVLPS